ncbi:MAG: peptide chain release factor N(5)-glutamine methyltransferase [Calothrix sp. C42_A2020_038]|nr:peptide chain release factor N(5)-glutamine methyltransferase [Calothrix sp. C42_A2020_038]
MLNPQFPYLISGLQLWQWRSQAIADAIEFNVEVVEVDWLLREITDLDSLALRLGSYQDQTQIQIKLSLEDLNAFWQRRCKERLPVQYITSSVPWRHFQLQVSPAVLIPRPETEYLIDLAIAATKDCEYLRDGNWADLGTGSGAIAIGLASSFEKATIHAVDVSPDALKIAYANACDLGYINQIQFYLGSWWEPLLELKGKFSGMVSNPPYIPTNTVLTLEPEVANHEPNLALDGGSDGLDYIRKLIEVSPEFLQPGAVWLIEMMAGQANIVSNLLHNHGSYCNIKIHADLAGIERFAVAYKNPKS